MISKAEEKLSALCKAHEYVIAKKARRNNIHQRKPETQRDLFEYFLIVAIGFTAERTVRLK